MSKYAGKLIFKARIVLAIYPVPLYTALQNVANELGKVNNRLIKKNLNAYTRGRTLVFKEKAVSMLITERMNKIRLKRAKADGAVKEQKLTEFTPLTRTVIRGSDDVLDEFVLGVAPVNKSTVKKLNQFARSEKGKKAINDKRFKEPIELHG